jgi:hypothetical protein
MPENDEYVAIETREKDEYVVMYEPRKKSELIAEIRPALETVDEDSVLNITQASAKSSENVNAWSTRSSHDNVGLYEVKTQPNEVEMQPMGIHTDFNDPESAGKFVVECFRAISPDAYTNVATNAGTGNAWFKFSLDSDGKLIANENISEITEPSRSTAEREITVERLAANGAFNYDNPVDFFTLAKGTMLSIDFPRTRMNLSVDGEPLSFDVENSQNKSPEEVQAEVGCRITDKLLKLADKVCNERHAHEADVDRIITGKSPEQWLEQREAEKKELFCKYMRAMCCAFKGQNDLKISKSLSEALSAFADDQGNRNQIFTSSTHNDFSANISVDRNGVTCSQEIFTLSNILKAHSRTRIISENSQGNANEGKELIPIVIDEKISFYASIDNPLERKLIPSGTSIALFDLNASAGGSAEMGSSRVNANGNPLESAKGKKIFEIRANGNFMPPIA